MMITSVQSVYQQNNEHGITEAKPQDHSSLSLKMFGLQGKIVCNSKKSNIPGKRVRFSGKNGVVGTVANRRDLTAEEMNVRWFSKPEYTDLIWESSVTLAIMKRKHRKHLIDDGLLCARGLIDKESLIMRQRERSFVNDLVHSQLRANRGAGQDEIIADLYRECASSALRRARKDALQDEHDSKLFSQQHACPDNKGFRITQAQNRTSIEQLIMKTAFDCQTSEDLRLKKALERLNKRKRREEQAKAQLEEMVLMQQLRELSAIYTDGNLSPDEKAAVEKAVEGLLRESRDETHPPGQSGIQSTRRETLKDPSPSDLVARAYDQPSIQEEMLYKMREQRPENMERCELAMKKLAQQQQLPKRQRIT